MELYRLAHAQYSALTGIGGLYGDGRWHHAGIPVIYTGSSRALCILERFVHESASTLPELAMLTLHVPDSLLITRKTSAELPSGWDLVPDTKPSKDFGSNWLKSSVSAVLQVPSAIVRDEFNFIINPAHPDFAKIKLLDTRRFTYDPRLKKFLR